MRAITLRDAPRAHAAVHDAGGIAKLFDDLAHEMREELWVVSLARSGRVIGRMQVAIGGVATVQAYPREVLRAALLLEGPSFVVVHNHPSGDANPSREDVEFTLRLREGADAIGLRIVDHVVVALDVSGALAYGSAMPSPRWDSRR